MPLISLGKKEPMLAEQDLYLFNEGTHTELGKKLGAHLVERDGKKGVHFAVWAPNANRVEVIADFNDWDGTKHTLEPTQSSGIWSGFFPGVEKGALYKYRIHSNHDGYVVDKADPVGKLHQTPPQTASQVWDDDYDWQDKNWMTTRERANALDAPMSIYEIHLGSWRRVPEDHNRPLNYRELAEWLPKYLSDLEYTHVELMPVMEHPFGGSWGYQITGFFAPTSRFGTPEDFKYLVDKLHQADIGVILDWVPSHFPLDEHGLAYFDGTHLFEHADQRQGFHPDWKSGVFNYGRNEVRAFLLSSAFHWLREFHIDGLRVDAVSSMLYLNYSREDGEWVPNEHGGSENLEAISFLQHFNSAIYQEFPDVLTIAEESTSWPMVSRPVHLGGLGFKYKWDMGWMHDTLRYFSKDPVHRKYHHKDLTFRYLYAFHENFVLSLSHDEVVHLKGSMLQKMPGDVWQKFANLRLLYASQYAHAGKKLLFMGGEFGQWEEWNHDGSLQWHLLDQPPHRGMQAMVRDLNRLYRREKALHEIDSEWGGFQWVSVDNYQESIISFLRKSRSGESILVALNFTPVPRHNFRVGVNTPGRWVELLNSDAREYGGSGQGNYGGLYSEDREANGFAQSIQMTLPPLGAVFFKAPDVPK